MIYPTPRVVLILLAGAPVALVVGLIAPAAWLVAAVWVAAVIAATAFDALIGPGTNGLRIELAAPTRVGVGEPLSLHLRVFDGPTTPPPGARAAVALDPRLAPGGRAESPLDVVPDGLGADFTVQADRRGTAPVAAAWVRWKGPLGLVWKQTRAALDRGIAVLPSIRDLRQDGLRMLTHEAQFGPRAQLLIGEGSEYEALTQFRPGMDRRAIDWKQSARHVSLLAKEYQIERDNRVVLAVDSGRTMSEPVGGLPRVDRAVSAALALAYVGLKLGDRISLFDFAGQPRALTPAFGHLSDFRAIQDAAAAIDYAHEETNYTLALARLGGALQRRSLIILFTEFSDPTSADLMIRAAGRLAARHRILFVVFADDRLDAISRAVPDTVTDVTRATVAATMQRDRRLVISRLQRAGVEVLEVPHDRATAAVLDAYLRVKRQGVA